MIRIIGVLLLLLCVPVMANHSNGLHLQLPNEVIDINRSDIDELHVFQTDAASASIMLKLKSGSADKLQKATEKALGSTAVWIWNGRVLSVEKLKQPMSRDLTVHYFKPEEAEVFRQKSNLSH